MKHFIVLLLVFFALFSSLNAQEIKIELGNSEIALNEQFSIKIIVINSQLKSYSGFPLIDGLQQTGTSRSMRTQFVGNRKTSRDELAMGYRPTRQGKVTIPSFSITVNGQTFQVPGKTITVTAPRQNQARRNNPYAPRDPWSEFFGLNSGPTEFVNEEADAFLALTTDKDQIYIGEGVTTTLALYVAEENRARLAQKNLSEQIVEAQNSLRPENSWEEDFRLNSLVPEPVTINNKRYDQYLLSQSTYYPLNDDDFEFPSVSIEFSKYLRPKNPSFFNNQRRQVDEVFHTRPKTVVVKDLPPHPLKDVVLVGYFHLDDKIAETALKTGEATEYRMRIYGEGNIKSIQAPALENNGNFSFYDPVILEDVRHNMGRVVGFKEFVYSVVPNEPGQFNLGDLVEVVFFNTRQEEYDTLRSQLTLNVTGPSRKNQVIAASNAGQFYSEAPEASNKLSGIGERPWYWIWANVLLLAMLLLTGYYLLFKKNEQ